MEKLFSNDFKRYFLITFTKELVLQSAKRDINKLQKIIDLKERKEVKKFQVKGEFIRRVEEPQRIVLKKPNVQEKITPRITRPITRQALSIPEPRLPSHLEYLKPVSSNLPDIDLGKLNPLIKDRAVKIIEVNPDEKVTVMGLMGTKSTDITLNKEDIDRVINAFSEISKIPTEEGIYRVAVGSLILSAIISEVVGSKFIVKKIAEQTTTQSMPYQSQLRNNSFRR